MPLFLQDVLTLDSKRVADDRELQFGSSAASFVRRDFKVDDGLKSVADELTAIQLIESSINIFQKGGLRLHKLHKFLCNSVMGYLPNMAIGQVTFPIRYLFCMSLI